MVFLKAGTLECPRLGSLNVHISGPGASNTTKIPLIVFSKD